jgi:hypothetical protein
MRGHDGGTPRFVQNVPKTPAIEAPPRADGS